MTIIVTKDLCDGPCFQVGDKVCIHFSTGAKDAVILRSREKHASDGKYAYFVQFLGSVHQQYAAEYLMERLI